MTPKNTIQAKVIRCNGDIILAETDAKNQMYLFLGYTHPEYKKLKKKKTYQFLLDIYTTLIDDGRKDVVEHAEKKYLLNYEFKGGSVYEGIVHGEIIRSINIQEGFMHWIKVDCGIVNWRNPDQIKNGTFVKIRARLDVDKIYDLNDNILKL